MAVIIIEDQNLYKYLDLMEDVYRFRHKLFVGHLGWKGCSKPDGREIDAFDGPGCTHIVVMHDGQIVGYSRLLPTTKPHLQSTLFRHFTSTEPPSGEKIFEWTRYGIQGGRHQFRDEYSASIAAELFKIVARLAHDRSWDGILAQTHPMLVKNLKECGWDVNELGPLARYEGHRLMCVYGKLQINTVERTNEYFDKLNLSVAHTVPCSKIK